MFCDEPITVDGLKPFVSCSELKTLSRLELDAMFDRELLMLDHSQRAFNEFVNVHRMMVMREILSGEGIEEGVIDEILLEFGARLRNDAEYAEYAEAEAYACPTCGLQITRFECLSCNLKFCEKCLVVTERERDHTCDTNVIDTMKLIARTCKQCPKCKTFIQKDEGGCDQMFCTKCRTTFSWNTGKEASVYETLHNPHFFEWQRSNGVLERNPDDDPCEGRFLVKNNDNPTLLFIYSVIKRAILTMNGLFARDGLIRESLRLNYIVKKLTRTQWKKRFGKHISIMRRNKCLRDILQLCLQSMYYISIERDNDKTLFDTTFAFFTEHVNIIMLNAEYNISDNIMIPYGTH